MRLFNRGCEVRISDYLFTTENTQEEKGLTIEWEYNIKNYDEPAELKVRIYNVPEDVVIGLKQIDPVVFMFGYGGELQTFFSGFLDTFEIERQGVDRIFKATCIEQDSLIFKKHSISYSAGTTSKYVIEDLAKRAGLIIKQLDLNVDLVYSTGYCVYGNPINEIRDIVKDSDSKLKIEGKEIYVYTEEINNNEAVLLDYESGLLEEPQNTIKSLVKTLKDKEKGKSTLYTHKVISLAIPLIKKNSIILVQSDDYDIAGQVIEIKINNYIAEYKIKIMDKAADGDDVEYRVRELEEQINDYMDQELK